MRRPQRNHEDSLDMLLDTMANMFGCIMFIAILVAILSGSGGLPSRDVSEAAVSATERGLEHLEQEVREMEEAAAFAERAFVDNREVRELLRIIAQLEQDRERALARLERATAIWQQVKTSESDFSKQLAATDAIRRAAEAEIERIEREMVRLRESRTVRARLPVERATRKRPKHVILRQGRFFEVYVGSGQDYGRPVSTDVVTQKVAGMTHISVVAGGGVRITEEIQREARWRSMCSSLDPARHFLYIVVFPDSYAEFSIVKQAAITAGLEYQVVPVDAESNLVLTPGTDFRTQ
jgi:hypothetical protein